MLSSTFWLLGLREQEVTASSMPIGLVFFMPQAAPIT